MSGGVGDILSNIHNPDVSLGSTAHSICIGGYTFWHFHHFP